MYQVSIWLKVKYAWQILGFMTLCYRLENLSIGRDIYKGLDAMQGYDASPKLKSLLVLKQKTSSEFTNT